MLLTDLTRLKVLNLANNDLSDLTPLANLRGLKVLDLYNNRINDICPHTAETWKH